MKLISFLKDKMQIHAREIGDEPENRLKIADRFESGNFYVVHRNGVDYIELDSKELMFFIKFLYSFEQFDLTEDGIVDLFDRNCEIFYSNKIGDSVNIGYFKYNGETVTDINKLLDMYSIGVFKDGLNTNIIVGI